jgi:hypothetical protein
MSALEQNGSDCLLRVWAKPRASRSRVVALGDEHVEIQLAAPPVDGAANKALIIFLAKALGLGKGRLCLAKGETSRHKLVRILDIELDEVRDHLEASRGHPKKSGTQE